MKESFLLSADNPVIKNHKVYGLPMLPGLAYIDLLYQVFRENGFDYTTLELRNLTIYNPLVVEQGRDVTLDIQCTETANGQWQLKVEGQYEDREKKVRVKKQYVAAEMKQREAAVFAETLSLDAVKQAAKQTVNLSEIYNQCRRRELVHTGFMKAEGVVYDLDAEVIIDLSVGPAAYPSAAGFMFHPVLLDGSAIGLWGTSALFKEEQRLSLPLFYESFRASTLLPKRCTVRVQKSSLRQKNELSFLTMEFFDDAEKKAGELFNYTGKLVRDAGLLNPDPTKTQKWNMPRLFLPFLKSKRAASSGSIAEAVESFLKQLLAERLNKPLEKIDARTGYYELGLDSAGLLELARDIERKTGTDLSPTLLFEYTNIADLSAYLAENYASKFAGRVFAGMPAAAPRSGSGPDEELSKLPGDERESKPFFAPQAAAGDIAVIGMAGRYPGAGNLREFWNNLKKGKESITEVPKDRWDWKRLEGINSPSGKGIPRWGGFIDDPACFDHEFFHLSPRQAEELDPQERLILETCWEAIEDAGYTPGTLTPVGERKQKRPVGVFIGVMHNDYLLVGAEEVSRGRPFPLPMSSASIANRISYFFDFHGPSITLDTMCSSSLTAVHLAVEGIRRGECRVALAGGVNLSLHPYKYMTYGLMDVLASGARCHPFGREGDGYLPGEGIGLVLLKPLSQAVRDRDNIYAVIKGSAANHGGTASGFTAPNLAALADLVVSCLENNGIDPRTISYVEAAANGSALGDPVEVAALTRAFRKFTPDERFCAIGSVKGNIGHAEAAAGISQLAKAVLQLHYQELVPTINAEPLNPEINLKGTPFYLQKELQKWKRPVVKVNGERREFPRRAAVNSFGAGGSNVHIILEEYEKKGSKSPAVSPQVAVISAKTRERLQAAVEQMLVFIEGQSRFSLEDLAYTLQVGREAMGCRLALVVRSREELVRGLKAYLKRNATSGDSEANIPIYTGDGGDMAGSFPGKGKEEDARRALLAEKDLEGLARHWVQGGQVNWELLHEGGTASRISLPTYPFARVRCWIAAGKERPAPCQDQEAIPACWSEENIREDIAHFLCRELGLVRERVGLDRDLTEYGMDSITAMKLLRHIEKTFGLKLTRREMMEHQTIKSLSGHLTAKIGETRLKAAGEAGGDKGSESLEKFKQGLLTLEEIEELIDKGEIIK
ncbi:MAG: beta-ketoacyl synthase N-terminal-like domain-containing protein [Peptococcaceae bacterium]|jgi:3-oxoacyl-(acyl-carrier-protein) synthase/acyl carrier protein|nr:phosphopantetheine-binding protein [Peptococcaceae bacterium]MDH7524369.1 beta-ketoacyl synthase N-terminal-like domain-containing protein [Peptococcaceae bacterium]